VIFSGMMEINRYGNSTDLRDPDNLIDNIESIPI